MEYNFPIYYRPRSYFLRLQNYDYYRSGLYFITNCTQNRVELFGRIEHEKMILNDYGGIIQTQWEEIPKYYPDVKLLEYIIMPNHIHGILWFTKYIGDPNPVGAIHKSLHISHKSPNDKNSHNVRAIYVGAIHELPLHNDPKSQLEYQTHRRRNMALPKIVGCFKMQSAKQINILRNMSGHPVWQRNYYEHIIRDEKSYRKIAEYIINNPLKWKEDKYYV